MDNLSIGVIGVSKMGSAIVETLLDHDYALNIWNRDLNKCKKFEQNTVQIKESALDVILKSNLIFFIIDKFSSIKDILTNAENLKGKVVVNCTTITPLETQALRELIEDKEGKLINTVIGNFPRQIGTDEAYIKCAGDPESWEKYSNIIKILSPGSVLLSTKPEYVNVLDAISVGIYQIAIVNFFEAVQLAEKYDISATELQSMVSRLWPVINQQLEIYSKEYVTNNYFESEAKLSTFAASVDTFIDTYEQVGVTPNLLSSLKTIMQSMVDQHKGNYSISGIFK
ncbi:NAD(P)-binding domain-containing protein [Acinetobacter baumannii]|uniref:NAD(P)-binding domain-containing protein n=1 Tax=Acinetobacter baumannii TaxID=470 RepID=UPI00244A368E|nr:NAD(P)-binding domain-containing protein [Acinetobacter baumannii]MDH2528291.1 NAD(P)-binding domain-containing protein [Acinetobacter baumannii]